MIKIIKLIIIIKKQKYNNNNYNDDSNLISRIRYIVCVVSFVKIREFFTFLIIHENS